MKFLCLGYLDVEAFDRLSEGEKDAILSQCPALCEAMRATGKVLVEAGLANAGTAKSIRTRNGRPWVTDGPFIETKEQLGSFFIVEAADIEEAIEIASMHPAALLGEQHGFGIEVRSIGLEEIYIL